MCALSGESLMWAIRSKLNYTIQCQNMLRKDKELNKGNQCDKFDESNMSGDTAQAQLFERGISSKVFTQLP